jgi:hypothetical protein
MRAALAILLALTIAVVYSGTISGLGREWTSSPDASYGVILAAVSVGVLWGRRDEFVRAAAASAPSPGIAGLVGSPTT